MSYTIEQCSHCKGSFERPGLYASKEVCVCSLCSELIYSDRPSVSEQAEAMARKLQLPLGGTEGYRRIMVGPWAVELVGYGCSGTVQGWQLASWRPYCQLPGQEEFKPIGGPSEISRDGTPT